MSEQPDAVSAQDRAVSEAEAAGSRGFDRPPDPAGTRPKIDPALLGATPIALPESDSSEPAERAPEAGDCVSGEIPGVDRAGDQAPGEPSTAPARRTGSETLMAETLTADSTSPTLAPLEGDSRASPVFAPPHANRFQFILGALIALGITAAALIALVLSTGRDAIPPRWSTWTPGSSDLAGVHEIANHVGAQYRLASGQQIVAVSGSPQEIGGVPVTVAVHTNPNFHGAIPVFNGTGVIYTLCGLGPKCSIAEGQPSPQRHLLLQRESLELALYTFRYIDGVSQVEVFMPSRRGQAPTEVLFFRSSQLADELSRPLDATLSAVTPSVDSVARSVDSALVDKLTTASVFNFKLASQNGSQFLVLQPA